MPSPGEKVAERTRGRMWKAGENLAITALLQAFSKLPVLAIPSSTASRSPFPQGKATINWNLKGFVMEKGFVTYEEFGAVGDGIRDDIQAIADCHAYANAQGLPVRAKDDAVYYIGGRAITAIIKTDTDWGTARFVIDDRAVEDRQQNCFKVMPDTEPFPLTLSTLSRDQKTLDFPHRGTCYVSVEDETRRVYIRKGLNRDDGFTATDRFLVDENGNILNPISWDYKTVTNAYAISVDDSPITISGGIFTTIANEEPSFYNYFERNIRIQRSHVTLQNVTHYVENEGEQGAPYDGFISIKWASFVTVRDCLMTAHKIYYTPSQEPGKQVAMGSYDLLANDSIRVRFQNIRQTTDIHDKAYWGIFCSNFCKELHLEGCVLSRFDAHCGVTNGSVRNCVLGHQGINLIGFGSFLVENTTVSALHFLCFRADYGSFFRGELTVKNCRWVPTPGKLRPMSAFHCQNTGDHDFGYPCALPENIRLELTIQDAHLPQEDLSFTIFHNYDPSFAPDKPYPFGTPKQLQAKISVASGKCPTLCPNPALFPHKDTYQL